ncbi:hypothetical protein REPUB_Repub09cG0091000 [Reevesia pubescens]
MLAYSNAIGRMEGRKDWPKTNIEESVMPLEIKKMSRKPKTNRKNDPNEPQKLKKSSQFNLSRKGMIMTCTLCHGEGHNKRRYPHRVTEVILLFVSPNNTWFNTITNIYFISPCNNPFKRK